jgi:hypothetical protein
MSITRRKKGRIIAAFAVALLLGGAAYAFTAANTVPPTKAGDGSGTISGYDVTGVSYNLDAVDPALISSYEFDLDAAAGEVKAKVLSTQVAYDSCVNTVLNHWLCTPTVAPTALSVDTLRVIAVQ